MRRTAERGNYALMTGLLSFGLIGFGAMAIDFSYLRVANLEIQAAADAGAHAALVAFRKQADEGVARAAALDVIERNRVAGTFAQVDPFEDVQFGGWDYNTKSFDPNAGYVNAVRVRVRRTADSPGGPIPMLLAPALGSNYSHARSEGWSIGALRTRDIMVAQDVTGSFRDEIDEARDADLVLLDYMHDHQFPDDQIGMNVFTGKSVIFTDLLPVETEYANIRPVWETLSMSSAPPAVYSCPVGVLDGGSCDRDECQTAQTCGNVCTRYRRGSCTSWRYRCTDTCVAADSDMCGSTNQGVGIEHAANVLLTDGQEQSLKIIVLVSDGEPYGNSSGGCSASAITAYGYDMADYAAANNISIFSISFNNPYNATQSAYMEALVRGYGHFYETPDETELPSILGAVGAAMPVALVE